MKCDDVMIYPSPVDSELEGVNVIEEGRGLDSFWNWDNGIIYQCPGLYPTDPEMEEEEEIDGGDLTTIYPRDDLYDFSDSLYPPSHLEEFSKKAITKYNQENEGTTYAFVELAEAFMRSSFRSHYILVFFKACQSDCTNMTTFRAETYSPFRTLSAPDLDIDIQVHSPSGSDISESDSQASPPHYQAEKLGAQVELLQICS